MNDERDESVERPVPIARLLAMAFRSLIDRMHERLAERGIRDVRPAYGFVLLAVSQGPIGVNDVAALLGVTKQAASKLVDALETEGYVTRVEAPNDARAVRLQLTRHGTKVLAAVEEIYAELEREWGKVIGHDRVESIRDGLATVIKSQHGGKLPPVRPTW